MAIAFSLVRFGLGLWSVVAITFRQSITAGPLLALAGASPRFISCGLGSLGSMLSGVLGTLLGLRTTLWIAVISFMLILLFTLFATSLPRIRSIGFDAREASCW